MSKYQIVGNHVSQLKMLVFGPGIHTKYSCQKSKQKRPLWTQSNLGLPCLSLATSVRNFRTFTILFSPNSSPCFENSLGPESTFSYTQCISILTLHAMQFFLLLLSSKLPSAKSSFRNTNRVSNSLDPDQDRHFVSPDLNPSCLKRLSADDKRGCQQGKGTNQIKLN